MKLRSVAEILPNTRVILRIDADVPMEKDVVADNARIIKSLSTIKLLLEKQCRMAIIGHRGRPAYDKSTAGKPEGYHEGMSLKPVYLELMTLLEPNGENLIESVFIENVGNKEEIDQALAKNQIVFLENLRFWKGEMNNDSDFLKGLIEVCQFYVNDAIAESHRKVRSIMLYRHLPGFYGLSFIDEVSKILRITENPERPLTIILGGAKEDKLTYLEDLIKLADNVLVGGKLPTLVESRKSESPKVIWAELREDGLDLSEEDIKRFREIILQSRTVFWVGAMGWYENERCERGTEEVARAITESGAIYRIVAGGDTEASIKTLGLEDKIDLVCSGGGVTLELLTRGKLPAYDL